MDFGSLLWGWSPVAVLNNSDVVVVIQDTPNDLAFWVRWLDVLSLGRSLDLKPPDRALRHSTFLLEESIRHWISRLAAKIGIRFNAYFRCSGRPDQKAVCLQKGLDCH